MNRLSAFAIFIVLLALPSLAYPQTRYALAIQGDQDQAFLGAFESLLLAQGAVLIDADRLKALDALAGVGPLLNGAVPKVITTLSADRLLAIRLSTKRLPGSRFIQHAHQRVRCSLSARLIAIDSAQALSAFRLSKEGAAAGQQDAKALATEYCFLQLAKALSKKIEAVQEVPLGLVEVTVKDLRDLSYLQAVTSALGSIKGVQNVKLVHAQHKAARFLVSLPANLSGLDLGFSLSERSDVGLVLLSASSRAVLCRYHEGKALTVKLFYRPFTGVRLRSSGRRLAALTAQSLLALPYVSPGDDGPLKSKPKAPLAVVQSELRAKGAQLDEALVLEGRLQNQGSRVLVSALLVAGKNGTVILRRTSVCKRGAEALLDCALSLAQQIRVALPSAVFVHRKAMLGVAFQRAAQKQRVQISEASIEPLFALHAARYEKVPVGSISLASESLAKIDSISVSTKVVGLGPERTESLSMPAPKAGAMVATIGALYVTLDERQARKLKGPKDVQVEVKIQWIQGQRSHHKTKTLQTVVFDRGTAPASDPRMFAALIDGRSRSLQTVLKQLRALYPQQTKVGFLAPVAAAIVVASSLEQTKNASGRHLQVEAPAKTLALGKGSCTDRAAVVMSLLSGLGADVGYMLKRDGPLVFVKVANTASLGQAKGLYSTKGLLYLPLDVCGRELSLLSAWQKGREKLLSHQGGWDQLMLLSRVHKRFAPIKRPVPEDFAFTKEALSKMRKEILASLKSAQPTLLALLNKGL